MGWRKRSVSFPACVTNPKPAAARTGSASYQYAYLCPRPYALRAGWVLAQYQPALSGILWLPHASRHAQSVQVGACVMSHLDSRGQVCSRRDGHPGRHHSVEARRRSNEKRRAEYRANPGPKQEEANRYYRQNRSKAKAAARRNSLRRFGLTEAQYDELLASQEGRCAICLRKPHHRRLAIDHDHRCCPPGTACDNCRRGLLCNDCNYRMLGRICQEGALGREHAISVLKRAVKYLDRENDSKIRRLSDRN